MIIKPYSHYIESEILQLYQSVGWSAYYDHPQMLRQAFANSLCILGAWEGQTLSGILRAVGDGHSIVFIQDILVLPDYQRQGIGTALVKALISRYPAVYQMELCTDNTEKTCRFYHSLGFAAMEDMGCQGFFRIQPQT